MRTRQRGLAAVEYLAVAATLIVAITAALNRPAGGGRTVVEEKALRLMNKVSVQLTSPGGGTADLFFEDVFDE